MLWKGEKRWLLQNAANNYDVMWKISALFKPSIGM